MGEAITYSYSLTQWILFFFWYCILGWIWECLFVSVKRAWKNKKWEFVNRGFLRGPVIPIYGFAAITILLATIQVRENTIAINVLGALTATLFELVTGTVMERLFKVKYWDYSDMPLNYHGHICLFVSLFWGAFSVLLVRVIHVPVENLLMQVPSFLCEAFAFALMAIFAYDTTTSFNEAMDLREVLESLSENNETVKRLERRFDAIVAFTPEPDIDDLRDMQRSAKEHMIYNVERLRWKSEERINQLKGHLLLPEYDSLPDKQEILEKLEMHRKQIIEKSNKQFLRAMNQLKRNPGAKSEKYQEMMELLYKLLENRD
mgnify:FL=1